MAVSDHAVNELRDKCGLPADECRAALERHGRDVDAALRALIDEGRVKPDQLNPDTVCEELFARAARRAKVELFRRFQPGSGLAAMIGRLAGGPNAEVPEPFKQMTSRMAEQVKQHFAALIGDKTPEQLADEDEAHRIERLKKAGIQPPSPGEMARLSARTKRRSEWLAAHPFTLNLPPFPPLERKMHEWTGRDVLTAWAGTQERQGGYTSLSSDEPSDGSFTLQIPRLGEDDENPRPPAPEQVAAYAYLKEHQDEITEAIMAALLASYLRLSQDWLKHDPDLELPQITSTAEMRRNVGLGTLHMHGIAKDGFAYLGLELGCTWDEEHGAGVLLHRGRVVAVGSADTSFEQHAAIEDGGDRLEV